MARAVVPLVSLTAAVLAASTGGFFVDSDDDQPASDHGQQAVFYGDTEACRTAGTDDPQQGWVCAVEVSVREPAGEDPESQRPPR